MISLLPFIPALSLCPLWPALYLNRLIYLFIYFSTGISIYDDLAVRKDLRILSKTNTQVPERVFNHNTSIFPSLKLDEIEISVFIIT